jgi:DNA-binding NarL/FixJ family response regulator
MGAGTTRPDTTEPDTTEPDTTGPSTTGPDTIGGTDARPDPAPAAVIRLVLVDDHRLFRAGVRAELDEAAGGLIEIVGEAGDAPSAIAVIATTKPDVVLLDVHLPGGGGIEVLKQSTGATGIRFLALSVSDAAEDVIGVVRGGARGYVTKSISGPELVDAIRRVAGGDAVFSPRLAGFVLDAFSGTGAEGPDRARGAGALPADDPELDRLTSREREVLRLIARGYAYKEIARELVISIKTVESHVSSVLRKLQLSNRYELSRWATDRRLL